MIKHKFNIFPEMQEEDYSRLLNDIKTNGFDKSQPIYVFQDEILDGWNRYRACNELSVKPEIAYFVGSDYEAINFVMRTNKRRNLNSSQWACIASEADELIAWIAEEVELERRRKQAETLKQTLSNEVSLSQLIVTHSHKNNNKNSVDTKIADTFNTNRTYVSEAIKLKETDPDLFEQVKNGEKTLPEVKKEKQKEIRLKLIEKQLEDIEQGFLPELKGLFDVISVDPPWPYEEGKENSYDSNGRRVANPYPEMSIQQIKEIQMPLMNDSIIFLWTTHKFLPDAFEILKEWGLDYKATLVWNKEKIGMGHWFRMQCEFCLVGIKGKPYWENTTFRDIIVEPRREHSRKPDSFFEMIEKITHGRRLEYFSREKRNGWEVFGNDINKF